MVHRRVGVYAAPTAHGAISDIIRRRSSNRLDVRAVALRGLPVHAADRLLDLGCGFGFMAEGLARRAHRGAEIVGVDVCGDNESAFMERIAAAGCHGTFLERTIRSDLDFLTGHFDGVAACYSLYYFPEVVGAVAAILRPGGFFVALTHSETSLFGLLDILGLSPDHSLELSLLRRFSAEGGSAVLSPHFGVVRSRPYPNTLVFRRQHLEDLIAYIRF